MGDRGTGERDGGGAALLGGLLLTILAASLCLVGCAGTVSSRPDDLPRNINEAFLDEEMDVDRFVERFEGESRAVYAERFDNARIVEANLGRPRVELNPEWTERVDAQHPGHTHLARV